MLSNRLEAMGNRKAVLLAMLHSASQARRAVTYLTLQDNTRPRLLVTGRFLLIEREYQGTAGSRLVNQNKCGSIAAFLCSSGIRSLLMQVIVAVSSHGIDKKRR
jgi:hypothetical protein